jgi:hypothetical protein
MQSQDADWHLQSDVLRLVAMRVVAIEHVHVAHLQQQPGTVSAMSLLLLRLQECQPPGQHIRRKSGTLSFSCVSRTVLPSAFFRQLCPSLRKKRTARRSNRNTEPPAQKVIRLCHVRRGTARLCSSGPVQACRAAVLAYMQASSRPLSSLPLTKGCLAAYYMRASARAALHIQKPTCWPAGWVSADGQAIGAVVY